MASFVPHLFSPPPRTNRLRGSPLSKAWSDWLAGGGRGEGEEPRWTLPSPPTLARMNLPTSSVVIATPKFGKFMGRGSEPVGRNRTEIHRRPNGHRSPE